MAIPEKMFPPDLNRFENPFTNYLSAEAKDIRAEYVAEIRKQVANYKRYKALNPEWVKLGIERSQLMMKLGRDA